MLPSDWIASKVDPPDGCHLCHVNESLTNEVPGGTPLTDFGSLMQANGAMPYTASATAAPALTAIEATEPQLITDLKNGTTPTSIKALSMPLTMRSINTGVARLRPDLRGRREAPSSLPSWDGR